MTRRVTFQSDWTGWNNPFQDSEISAEADQIIHMWREGRLGEYEARQARSVDREIIETLVEYFSPRNKDQNQTEQSPAVLTVEPRTTAREQTSNKLYQKFLKWKEKRKLFHNLFRMHS